MINPAIFLLAATAATPISDAALIAFDAHDYDKSTKMQTHEVLGTNHGALVVVDYPCSDLCPQYTTRIIHYAVEPGPDCARAGDVVRMMVVPVSIAAMRKPFCIPGALADRPHYKDARLGE
jgi:hypothetical protein